MKFALISNVLPPSESAHAAIIHRLLRDLDPTNYCLLSSRDYVTAKDHTGCLPAKHYYLPPPFQFTRGYRLGMRFVREQVNLGVGIVQRARLIARILRREKCEAVVVCTGGNEILDFPAGYLASRLAGARFYPYLLDQYFHMVSYVHGKHLLQYLESPLLKGATAVIAPNEFLRDELRRRFRVEATVIYNSCDLSAYDEPLEKGEVGGTQDRDVRIVYTGAVGPMHYNALRNLLAAIDALGREDVRLHLYTAQPRARLEDEGIRGPRLVFHEHEPVSAMPAVQRCADVLFLPLAFESPHPEIVRTAQPGKMGEYLAARRPVLVHAPPDSFIAWYFRRHECGVVADQNDPARLACALDSVLRDAALREKLGARARARAEADFSLTKARARFAEVLGLHKESC
jgi:glycosyltransferase involved in cell wall biosynthesis